MDNTAEGPDSPPADAAEPGHTLVPRACDACRARKIRCNRESPCAHCLNAKIPCIHSDGRPREKRSRILLTHQYEQKIDHIDRRLDAVISLLKDLKTQVPSPSPNPAETIGAVATAPSSSSPASHASHTHTTGTVAEGDSSLTAHSIFANDLLQKVVSKDSDSRPEMRERLDALGHLVEAMKKQPAAHEMTYPHAKPVRPAALQGCDLPPIDMTLQVLKLAKSSIQGGGLAWVYELFNLDRRNFPETCLAVYMADDHNTPNFITVNVVLHCLFWAYASAVPSNREEYLDWSRLCGVNVETALSNLPLHLPASDDVIVALSLGTYYAIELSKPSLAWILTSKASELCQTLGYHRSESYKKELPDDAQYKQSLFWIVYVVDKSLSLRLGRPSTIQDFDVTVPYTPRNNQGHTAITSFFQLWVIASRIQGQIYELLYCPEAIAQPEPVRRSRVQLLVGRLEELDTLTREATKQWDQSSREVAGGDIVDFFTISDQVLRLSLLTLIHRALPNPVGSPSTFTPDCIQAARTTLARHQDCMTVVERSNIGLFSTYMSWTILFAPFVPFIVLFCQVIETRDKADLARLQAFVASLQPDMAVSEVVDRHRRLFQVLYSVASHYVDSYKTSDREEHQQSTMSVDTYLAALGFPSQTVSEPQQEAEYLTMAGAGGRDATNQEFQRGVNPMIWMGNGAQLEDWLYNNQQMTALLEDGFSDNLMGRWEAE